MRQNKKVCISIQISTRDDAVIYNSLSTVSNTVNIMIRILCQFNVWSMLLHGHYCCLFIILTLQDVAYENVSLNQIRLAKNKALLVVYIYMPSGTNMDRWPWTIGLSESLEKWLTGDLMNHDGHPSRRDWYGTTAMKIKVVCSCFHDGCCLAHGRQ